MSSVEWYVLHSQPRREMLLSELVCNHGIQSFCPTIKVHPKNPRARKIVPYFPGYLFVYIDLDEVGISTLKWMPYGTGLVSFDGIPASVPEALIHEIIHRVDEINSCCEKPLLGIKHGDRVLIDSGMFEGYEAIFDTSLSGNERVRVLLQLMGQNRSMPVILPAHQIKARYQRRPS